jgi:sulfoxide reductase heme-binding subunit YedZ
MVLMGWLKSGRDLIKPMLFITSAIPLVWIIYQGVLDQLGADPAKSIADYLGLWGLRFLLITLTVTSLRVWFGWRWQLSLRRMLGLYAFFYVLLHLLAVITFIMGWRIDILVKEVTERPFIIVGMLAFLLLIPLAVTSTQKWQRRLGRSWKRLHQLIYPIAILAVLHLVYLIRASYLEAFIYVCIVTVLLMQRVVSFNKGRTKVVRENI